MISSPSTLPQPSHEGDEGQSAGRKTFRPPGPKKALNRVSDAEQQLVARYVDRDTACDDAQHSTVEPRTMFEQPGVSLFRRSFLHLLSLSLKYLLLPLYTVFFWFPVKFLKHEIR